MNLTPADKFNFIINYVLTQDERFKVLDELRRLEQKIRELEDMTLEEIDKKFYMYLDGYTSEHTPSHIRVHDAEDSGSERQRSAAISVPEKGNVSAQEKAYIYHKPCACTAITPISYHPKDNPSGHRLQYGHQDGLFVQCRKQICYNIFYQEDKYRLSPIPQ